MADNSQKTPFALSINKFAADKVYDVIQLLGKKLPCSVVSSSSWIVTVKFELANIPYTLPNVTVPVAYPNYLYIPFQAGDKGFVNAVDAYIGAMTGQGGGTADLSQLANLSNLVFEPLGNQSWTPTDANKIELFGPNGFVIRDTGNHCSVVGDTSNVTITAATSLTLKAGGKTVVINSSGVTIDGRLFETHVHTGVTTGSGDTGPPL